MRPDFYSVHYTQPAVKKAGHQWQEVNVTNTIETLQQVSKEPSTLTPATALIWANFGVTGRSTSPLIAKANCPLVQHLQELWQANMY